MLQQDVKHAITITFELQHLFAHTTLACHYSYKPCNSFSLSQAYVRFSPLWWIVPGKHTCLLPRLLWTSKFRTSVTNCARIYNMSFTPDYIKAFLPYDWKPSLSLYYDDVWDSFFIYSLLIDHKAQLSTLQVPNQAWTQVDRLWLALESCNHRMMGPGQPEWNHACETCVHVFPGENGEMHM